MIRIRSLLPLFALGSGAALGAACALAHPSMLAAPPHAMPMAHPHPGHEEQNAARRELRRGQVQSLRDIERRVLPSMRGMQYLGPEFDSDAMAYRLKFIRDGRVSFVDVDARTGQVLDASR